MAFVFSIPNGPRMLRTIKGRVPPRRRRYTRPLSRPQLISGITRDNTGVALAGCTVFLFRTADKAFREEVVSDAAGAYTFSAITDGAAYFTVEYKAGSPDVTISSCPCGY